MSTRYLSCLSLVLTRSPSKSTSLVISFSAYHHARPMYLADHLFPSFLQIHVNFLASTVCPPSSYASTVITDAYTVILFDSFARSRIFVSWRRAVSEFRCVAYPACRISILTALCRPFGSEDILYRAVCSPRSASSPSSSSGLSFVLKRSSPRLQLADGYGYSPPIPSPSSSLSCRPQVHPHPSPPRPDDAAVIVR